MSVHIDTIVETIVPTLSASTLSVAVLAAAAVLGAAFAGRHRVAVRHVVLIAALAASIVAMVASLSRASVTIEVPWWRQVMEQTASVAPARGAVRRESPRGPGDAQRALAWLWLAGVTCVALRAFRHAAAARALRRRAIAVTDPAWTQALVLVRESMRYEQPLAVLVSAEIDVPFVTGLRRPAVLIPSAGTEWSTEEKRSVLAHEIAHLTRFDLWTRVVAQVACALHWFNPVVWLLASRADRDAELAADDLALRSGILPSTYADALLTLAERIAWRRPAPAVLAFVRRSSLGPRIHAVLAPSERPQLVGTRARVVVIGASCAITAAIGCVRLTPRVEAKRVPSVDAPVAQAPQAEPRTAPEMPVTPIPRPTAPKATGDWVDDAVNGLVDALRDPSPQVRAAAAASIHRFDDGASRAAVDRALGDANLSRATLERIRTEKQ